MDGKYLTPETILPPRYVRLSEGNGHIGPCRDGHLVTRNDEEEDGIFLEVTHPEHCFTHGEGELAARREKFRIGGMGTIYKDEGLLVLADYATCVWEYILQWHSSTIDDEKIGESWAWLYGSRDNNAVPTLEEALPFGVPTAVTWTSQWWTDSYNGEYENAFSWWVER